MNKSSIPFVGLHAHSTAGSPFDAIGFPQQHMDFAYENGMDALALTDHGNCNGLAYQVLHAKSMEKEGKSFKPIYGCEAYFIPSIKEWEILNEETKAKKKRKKEKVNTGFAVEDEVSSKKVKDGLNRRSHLVLLAQNQAGLNNIFKLVSQSYKPGNFYRFPRLDLEMLREHSEGVIASSACLGGVYATDYWKNKDESEEKVLEAMRLTTENMLGVLGDRWHGELQWWNSPDQHNLNQFVIKISKEYNLPLISTCDSHFYNPEVWKDRELYKRLHPGLAAFHGDMPESLEQVPHELYPKNGEQMWESYKKYSSQLGEKYDDDLVMESIERTYDIAHNRIEKFYPDNTVRLPSFVIPDGLDEDTALSVAASNGLQSQTKHSQEYLDRLKHELEVIKDRGFSRYFLTMKAIADKATSSQLAGPSRGSAGGSLVAYALGITQVDPIKYGLLFSRFLRADATDYPDIDYDVSDPFVLKELLVKEWGEDNVVPISNWNTLQLRSLIKDISKLYKIPFQEVNKVTGKMVGEAIGPAKAAHGIKTGIYAPTFDEVMRYSTTLQQFLRDYPEVETHCRTLVGQVRSCSRHAGGLVVGENLNQYMPLIYSGGVRQTPWTEGQNVRHLEPMGFIKFDILGLSTLRMIEDSIEKILERHKGVLNPKFSDIKNFYDEHLHPDKLDFDNQDIYKNIFHKGKWAGVFQFTEAGAQGFCKKAKPTSLVDIAAITSVFRPGPLCLSGDTEILRTFAYYDYKNCKKGKKRSTTRIKLEDLYTLFHKPNRKNYLYLPSYTGENGEVVKNKVINVVKSGKKKVYSIKYQRRASGGKRIVSTSVLKNKARDKQNNLEASLEHRFLTKDGYRRLSDLVEGDYILVINQGCQTGKDPLDGRSGRKSVWGRKNFRNIAFYHYDYKCVLCDWKGGSLDVNHMEGNRDTNNSPENLCYLCPNHHRQYTEGLLSKDKVLLKRKECSHPFYTKSLMWVRYLGKEYEREVDTYDIEMDHPFHNFIAGSCVVHNSAKVDRDYVEAKENPQYIKYPHPIIQEVTEETYGFLIFQEQIALLAHRLGKDISLDEGNLLRKLLTKKGTGKGAEEKNKIHTKFLAGCLEKGISKKQAEELWSTFEYFSGYGFNKSHAVGYSILSYQCAWLLNYYPAEWCAAFLNKEPEGKKERAINVVKNLGYEIQEVDINTSGRSWDISSDGKLIQPLTSIKGLGDKAMDQILQNRPFTNIENFLFNEKVSYSKLNKKALDVLVRSGACDSIADDRFKHCKHLWLSAVNDRPKNKKRFEENVIKYCGEVDFTEEERIENIVSLTGIFPFELVMDKKVKERIEHNCVPPIAQFDKDLGLCWLIPRSVTVRQTKNGRDFWIINVIDDTCQSTDIKCWNVKSEDKVHLNRPYITKLDYDEQWGFSTRSVKHNFILVG